MKVYVKKQNLLWQKTILRVGMLVLLVVLLNLFQGPVRNSFYVVATPATKAFGQIGSNASNFFQSLFSFRSLRQENDNLHQENQKLLSEISLLQNVLREGQTQKVAAENLQDRFTYVAGTVVGLDASNDLLLINKGSDDGIEENMPLVTEEKVVLGKILKVYKNFSQALLISNSKSVLDIKIQSDDPASKNIHGVVKGNGNLSVYLDLVALDEQLKNGDVLVTSGLEGVFPANLLIGEVSSVSKNDLKPFQTGSVELFFDQRLEQAFVITNYIRK